MFFAWRYAALLLGSLLLAEKNAPPEILIDEVVATVNRQVITRSEVMQEGRLILVQRFGADALQRRLTPKFLAQVLELLVNQRVLSLEALRLGLPPVNNPQRQQLLEGFRRRFDSEEQYRRFLYRNDYREEAIAEILARHLWIERLKERKLRSLPEVTDAEVRSYYERHRLELGAKPLALVGEAIRLKLLTRRREKFLAQWLWQLRRQSEVRILVDFGDDKQGGEQ